MIKRILPLIGMMIFLAGCFRTADDSFETIDSSSDSEVSIEQPDSEPTTNIVVIDPNASPDASEPTATVRVVQPTVVAQVATDVPTATPQSIATATEPSFVTPEIEEENQQPTTVPTDVVTQPTLQPTPTAEGNTAEATAGECGYAVQSGDNLFRIAVNNGVTLPELLAANGLTEGAIIQPGQILQLPNCEGGVIVDAPDEPAEEATPIILDDCDYEIVSGDTLFDISLELEVPLADLLAENGLSDTSIIQPGDILTIPNCEDGDTAITGDPEPITAETTPDVDEPIVHTVVSGDSIQSIAQQYGVTVNAIIQANTIPNPNSLTVGQQLTIPTTASGE